jgi:hypothetical protein
MDRLKDLQKGAHIEDVAVEVEPDKGEWASI